MDREKMKSEAVNRMEVLGMFKETISRFKDYGQIFISKPVFGNRAAALYELNDAEQKVVKEAEEKYGILVYHVIQTNTNIGMMYSMLYVSKDEEEWGVDMEDLRWIQCGRTPCPMAYVWNAGNIKDDAEDLTDGFGEFGSIQIAPGSGGLCRVG